MFSIHFSVDNRLVLYRSHKQYHIIIISDRGQHCWATRFVVSAALFVVCVLTGTAYVRKTITSSCMVPTLIIPIKFLNVATVIHIYMTTWRVSSYLAASLDIIMCWLSNFDKRQLTWLVTILHYIFDKRPESLVV